jgi:glyoxylase-like metal-dependent hydrolase (beta-lactamase superfamily II)
MDLVPVADGVWACLQEDKGLGWSNSGLIGAGGGMAVDTFYDLPLTRALIDQYVGVLGQVPTRLLNTHHNGDHCWGNQLFAEAGTEIIGHRECAARVGKDLDPKLAVALQEAEPGTLPPHLEQLAQAYKAFDFTGVVPTPPTTLLDGDDRVDLGEVEVQLLFVGPAHTAGDVVAWLPESRVLFTGDVLFHQCTPIGWEGTFAQWIGALERLEALEPAVVVPGHGPLCDVDGLRAEREYLTFVRAEAVEHHAAGRSAWEAAQRIELGPFAAWNEPWRLPFQVHRAYRELEGGAWDDLGDVGAVMGEVFELQKLMTSA